MRAVRLIYIVAIVLAGCGKGPEQGPEDIRPVRVQQVQLEAAGEQASYSGEVRARHETRLAFRVAGKIISRHVEVGQEIKKGQLIARIDPKDLELSEAALQAQVVAAQTAYEVAANDLKRYEELRRENFISEAELERHRNAYTSAKSQLDEAKAQHNQVSNQSSYATLETDVAGVITAIEAEAGQVVAAGQTVVRLARPEEKEVVISVPEQRVDELKRANVIDIRLWANPEKKYSGSVREIAPASDPVTRTYIAKISLTNADQEVRLGMTATVQTYKSIGKSQIFLPMTAIFDQNGKPAVWVVEPKQLTVSLVPVTIGGHRGNDVTIVSGLSSGQLIVTAGVHLLRAQQKVRILDNAG